MYPKLYPYILVIVLVVLCTTAFGLQRAVAP